MSVGASLFLIAIGAILRYAVTDSVSGVDLTTIGLILMIAGAAGLVIGLFMMTTANRGRDDYRDPPRGPGV
jgi:hypothetical protein